MAISTPAEMKHFLWKTLTHQKIESIKDIIQISLMTFTIQQLCKTNLASLTCWTWHYVINTDFLLSFDKKNQLYLLT